MTGRGGFTNALTLALSRRERGRDPTGLKLPDTPLCASASPSLCVTQLLPGGKLLRLGPLGRPAGEGMADVDRQAEHGRHQ